MKRAAPYEFLRSSIVAAAHHFRIFFPRFLGDQD
jgi:hypothetical protein